MPETEEHQIATLHLTTGRDHHACHVFSIFPESEELFAADIHVREIISRHGHAEWRAAVLTNELHGHLGIYAIIGVKMGVRATELLHTGIDDIHVTSFAGSTPPVSCMNDGLQVSTGGTVGHGLFSVSTEKDIRPSAVFTFKNKEVHMQLKSAYTEQIKQDITTGIRMHGTHTQPYWQYVRKLAIRYWNLFDRKQLFIESIRDIPDGKKLQ